MPLVFPSDEEKNEAARLLARAFSSAGGAKPRENGFFGNHVDDAVGVRKCGDDDVVGPARTEEDRDQMALAEVHLVMSGFSLKEGRGGGSSGDGATEWHLQEATRVAPPDTKAGIISRCIGRCNGADTRRSESRPSIPIYASQYSSTPCFERSGSI